MFPLVRDAIAPFNTPLEGRGNGMYLDIKSLVTTGIGNLIDADSGDHFGTNPHLMPEAYGLGWAPPGGAPVSTAAIDAEYQRIKYSGSANWSFPQRIALCQLFITDQAIDELVARKADSFGAFLVGRPDFAGFETFPADAQLGLLSMSWAMGPAFRFPRFQAAVRAGDWVTAAAESHMDDANNPGLRPRNAINEVLFSIASWVVAPEPGDPAYLYWNTSLSLGDNLKSNTFPIPLNTNAGVQAALDLLGYDPHGIDGIFTKAGGMSNTQRAIVNFQTANGLPTTPTAAKAADIGADTANALASGLDGIGMYHWLP
jgi:GH24 family phage-related lysozyme (muramidase)